MEGNKDEAAKCIDRAKTFMRQGLLDNAIKFLKKAERLYPSEEAKELLEAAMQENDTPNGSAGGEKPGAENGETNARRRRSSGGRAQAAEAEYTTEQLESVRRIKKCKDYYEILEVAKDCTDSDLKKQYRKLALQFHPDKNKAPGATEAFKAIGNAYAVLSDTEKRKQYNMYGSDEARRASAHSRHHPFENGFDPRFEADITADELFNMFFGGGYPSNNVYVRRGQRWTRYPNNSQHYNHHHHHHETSSYSVLLQILPILLVILVSMMSNFLSTDPVYMFSPSPKYPIEKKTANLRVSYFVKTDFAQEYQGSLRKLEQNIEAEYVTTLKQNCYRERNYKESLLWQARNFGDQRRLKRAQEMKMPSCESLQSLYAPS